MGKKKILCCLAMLLQLARMGGSVKGVSNLRNRSVEIIDFVKTLDPEVTAIDSSVNGKKGIIAIAEGLTDAMGRLSVFSDEVPTDILDRWSEAADAVLHP